MNNKKLIRILISNEFCKLNYKFNYSLFSATLDSGFQILTDATELSK